MTTTITLTVEVTIEHSQNLTKEELADKAYWLVHPMLDEACADPASYGMDDCRITNFEITKNTD